MYTEMNDEFAFARPYLAPGEAIFWRGRPEKGHLLSGKDVLLIPFGIFYCGFAIFWTVSALTVAPLPFAMFGVPFICVGLYITIGRSIHTASVRKRTVYVITNQKILRRRGNKIDMLDAKTMPAIHVTARTDGTGTIRFGESIYYHRGRGQYNNTNMTWVPNEHMFTLENIPDVARVQQILHSIAGN